MAKVKPEFNLRSHGIYSQWDSDSKELPKIQEYTLEIPARVDIEFGYILNVKKGKGIELSFCIFHPDVPDEKGKVMPPFTGEVFVKNNDWDFFLGDTIWSPVENKTGRWQIVIYFQDKVIADKTFIISDEDVQPLDEFAQFKRRVKLKGY